MPHASRPKSYKSAGQKAASRDIRPAYPITNKKANPCQANSKNSCHCLTFIGLGAIFGSGWLFAASHVSAIAGPAGILSWFLGGFAVLLLGIVYCELGAALPRAGGVVRYPVYSHGPLLGYLMGFITLIAFSSLIAIEVVASRQYAAAWFPGLTKAGSSDPTVLGWLVQFALLGLFFFLNYRSVKTFAKANNLVSVFKFIVPLLVIGVLFTFFKPENFEVQGFAPFGLSGVEMAVSAGGIIFAYLGLTPIISVASEVKNPQRTIPIALILSVLLSTAIYATGLPRQCADRNAEQRLGRRDQGTGPALP